jgi:hypothetical protein
VVVDVFPETGELARARVVVALGPSTHERGREISSLLSGILVAFAGREQTFRRNESRGVDHIRREGEYPVDIGHLRRDLAGLRGHVEVRQLLVA